MFAGVFVVSLAMLGGSAWMAQRGWRSCLCCSPRRRFKTVAERRFHERLLHFGEDE